MSNEKNQNTIWIELSLLLLVTALFCAALGFTSHLALKSREEQKAQIIYDEHEDVFVLNGDNKADFTLQPSNYRPGFLLETQLEATYGQVGEIYDVYHTDGTFAGCVLDMTAREGYYGPIVIRMAVSTDGTINGIRILKMNPMQGLDQILIDKLLPQFIGKKADSFASTTANEEDEENAVKALPVLERATKSITDAVNGGLMVARDMFSKWGGGIHE
jgi:Na+-translocating ferredoxin:NAD+ oxidoreductase RnfG subunit